MQFLSKISRKPQLFEIFERRKNPTECTKKGNDIKKVQLGKKGFLHI